MSGPQRGAGPERVVPTPDLPRWRRTQVLGAWWVLPAGLTVALVVLLTEGIRPGGYVTGAVLALAALLRLVLPDRRAGGLVVRTKALDVLTLGGLSLAVVVLSATLVIR